MTRFTTPLLVACVVGVALGLTLDTDPAPAALGTGPLVRLVSSSPLTLAGTGFAPHERVRLEIALRGTTHTVVVTAGTGGGFERRLSLARNRSEPLAISARGNRGSRAGWTLNALHRSLRD